MLKHFLKTLAISAALTVFTVLGVSAASTGGAEVTADALNLRLSPSASAPAITQTPAGSLVVVGDIVNEGWMKVVYRGATGYMSSQYLSFSQNMDGSFGFGTVNGSEVNLRSGPSFFTNPLAPLPQGMRLDITGVNGQWYKVIANGISGYVHSDSLALNGGVADEFISPGQLIVDTAMKYLDVPYVWGGTSTSGFDCSGLVYYVYKECGYTINRTAASIYTNGEYVEKSALKPGDAVCFSSSSSSIGHVGIYIGDGEFIHASSGSGRVIISELSGSYYTRRYVGARRIA